mmetsp:Transcript_76870/g.168019  ORF Transcript_76870/g.168019 Transcript_76870/m.168019 type:complete len:271 (+) Transcript_76870:1389-2201(+)
MEADADPLLGEDEAPSARCQGPQDEADDVGLAVLHLGHRLLRHREQRRAHAHAVPLFGDADGRHGRYAGHARLGRGQDHHEEGSGRGSLQRRTLDHCHGYFRWGRLRCLQLHLRRDHLCFRWHGLEQLPLLLPCLGVAHHRHGLLLQLDRSCCPHRRNGPGHSDAFPDHVHDLQRLPRHPCDGARLHDLGPLLQSLLLLHLQLGQGLVRERARLSWLPGRDRDLRLRRSAIQGIRIHLPCRHVPALPIPADCSPDQVEQPQKLGQNRGLR